MRVGARNMVGMVNGMRAMNGPNLPHRNTMRSRCVLEKEKVRKVNQAREVRDQKGAGIRAQKGLRVSMGAIRKVAEPTYPPQVPNLALCSTVVFMLIHLIVTAIPDFRKV